MLLPPDSLHVAFQQIKQAAKAHPEDPSYVSTLILASMETDSVCATKLICDALKLENIMFSLQVVNGFQDVDRVLPPLLRNGTFLSVVLINCGGTVDLTRRFGEELLDGIYLYVIDSHRPLHHKNLHASASQVLVFGGEIEDVDEDIPGDDDDEEELLEDEDDDEEAEEEAEAGGENDQPNVNEEELEESRQGADEDKAKEGAEAKASSKAEMALRKQERRSVVRNYYKNNYIGQPASDVAFTLLQQLGRTSKLSSWMAIVGFTSRYICTEIDDEAYLELVDKYRQIVLDQNSSVKRFRQSLDDNQTFIPTPSREQIEFIPEEVRLVLYRHWSLQDAFRNTEFFAARFGSWSVETSGTQERFLAKLGMSLRDAGQKYAFMSKESKDKVKHEMKAAAETFEYFRMTFPSFSFRTGFDKEVSAEDAARYVTALLSDTEVRTTTPGESEFQARQTSGFNAALELLSKHQPYKLHGALQLAMKNASLLTSETIAVIQGGLVQNAGVFRYAVVELHEDDDDREGQANARAVFFSCPANVVQLAKHIINANQGSEKWLGTSAKPLVLAVIRKDRALVTAVACPGQTGDVLPNPFGRLFAAAARDINIDINTEQFLDPFVIEISAEDVQQRFLGSLALTLSE